MTESNVGLREAESVPTAAPTTDWPRQATVSSGLGSAPPPAFVSAPVPSTSQPTEADTASPRKKKRRPALADEPVRKSSRRSSGLFGPDRPTYREPSSDEEHDSGQISDGDPPYSASMAPPPLPESFSPVAVATPLPESVSASENAPTPPPGAAESIQDSPMELVEAAPAPEQSLDVKAETAVAAYDPPDPATAAREWKMIENIVFSVPQIFVNITQQIAS